MERLPLSFDSFRDVSAALAEPALSLGGVSFSGEERAPGGARESLPRSEIARLEPAMRASARAMAQALSADGAVDLVATFAAPWSRELAIAYAAGAHEPGAHEPGAHEPGAREPGAREPGANNPGARTARAREESERLIELTRQVFTDAAHATSRTAATAPSRALLPLAQAIGSDRAPLVVQGIVALANTLPLLLAGAWHVLVVQPGAWQSLRRMTTVRTSAIDELLRLASPARVVFRQAAADMTLGTRRVASGDEVLLALYDANRCPAHFDDAERFVAERFAADRAAPDGAVPVGAETDRVQERVAGCRHVGLGLHPHACAGGALVRLALEVSTTALLDEFDQATLAGPVTWLGGFAIDGITSLPVTLQRARDGADGESLACPT